VRVGDLVRSLAFDFSFDDRLGVIIAWVRAGGSDGTVWEVLYPDNTTEYWDENNLLVISESQ
jgi:hypothetical protein